MCTCKYVSLRCPLKWGGSIGIISNGIEYFDIVQRAMCTYLYCIYVMKMHWLFVQTQSALCTAVGQSVF